MPGITLLPMIHIGERDYFREMNTEMWRHDTAFLEGCYMPGRKLFHLFHRSIGRSSQLSLQSGKMPVWKKWKRESKTQGQSGLTENIRKNACNCGHCFYDELHTVRADLHRWHALKAFKLIPLWAKLTLPFLILAAILAAPFMNLRDFVFDAEEEDDSEEQDGFMENLIAPFWKFVIEDRDLFLRMVLAEEVLRPRHSGKRLCVKYGAKHMPVLTESFLRDFGYVLANQRDVLAVKKTKAMDVTGIDTGYGHANAKYWEEMEAQKTKAKAVVTYLSETDPNNLISLRVGSGNFPTTTPLTVQTDLSGFNDIVKPASAA